MNPPPNTQINGNTHAIAAGKYRERSKENIIKPAMIPTRTNILKRIVNRLFTGLPAPIRFKHNTKVSKVKRPRKMQNHPPYMRVWGDFAWGYSRKQAMPPAR